MRSDIHPRFMEVVSRHGRRLPTPSITGRQDEIFLVSDDRVYAWEALPDQSLSAGQGHCFSVPLFFSFTLAFLLICYLWHPCKLCSDLSLRLRLFAFVKFGQEFCSGTYDDVSNGYRCQERRGCKSLTPDWVSIQIHSECNTPVRNEIHLTPHRPTVVHLFPLISPIFYTRRSANSLENTSRFLFFALFLNNEASCFDHSFILFGGYA